MKIKIRYFLIFIVSLQYLSCQKLNLQKDGYFILKTNDSRTAYDKCYFRMQSIASISSNCIFAGKVKKGGDSIYAGDYDVFIYYEGNTTGNYTSYNPTSPTALYVMIKANNKEYLFPSFDFSTSEQLAEINLAIDEYNSGKGKCKGSISGKFINPNDRNDFVTVKTSKFVAMDFDKH